MELNNVGVRFYRLEHVPPEYQIVPDKLWKLQKWGQGGGGGGRARTFFSFFRFCAYVILYKGQGYSN